MCGRRGKEGSENSSPPQTKECSCAKHDAGTEEAFEVVQEDKSYKAAKARKQSAEDQQDRGQLGPLATSILMRILYAAREARFDLLRAVNKMSCLVAY